MADLKSALQKAIVAAMADITAPSQDGGTEVDVAVYDHQPDNAPYPYVSLASQLVTASDGLDFTMGTHAIYLSIWSEYRGQRQINAIMSAIRDRLHHTNLPLDSGECLLVRVTSESTVGEPDGATYQGAMTITAIVAD